MWKLRPDTGPRSPSDVAGTNEPRQGRGSLLRKGTTISLIPVTAETIGGTSSTTDIPKSIALQLIITTGQFTFITSTPKSGAACALGSPLTEPKAVLLITLTLHKGE